MTLLAAWLKILLITSNGVGGGVGRKYECLTSLLLNEPFRSKLFLTEPLKSSRQYLFGACLLSKVVLTKVLNVIWASVAETLAYVAWACADNKENKVLFENASVFEFTHPQSKKDRLKNKFWVLSLSKTVWTFAGNESQFSFVWLLAKAWETSHWTNINDWFNKTNL